MPGRSAALVDWVFARIPARVLRLAGSFLGRGGDDDDWLAESIAAVDGIGPRLTDPGWRWEMGDNPTEGAVAIVHDPEASTPTIVRFARSDAATESLRRHWEQINEIAADERVGGWRSLAPQPVAWQDGGDAPHVVERLGSGVMADHATRATSKAVARLAADALAPLHERTGRDAVVDEADLEAWIREPVARLRDITRHPERLALLERRLIAAWEGRAVVRSRVLGDLSFSNILLDPSETTVVGFPDWRRGGIGPAVTDLAHLAPLTMRADRNATDLGREVARALDDATALEADPLFGSVDRPVPMPEAVLLTWLWHVDASPHRTSRLWAVRNVEVVL